MNDERRGEERIGESGGRERRTGEKEFGSVVSTLNRRGEEGREEEGRGGVYMRSVRSH